MFEMSVQEGLYRQLLDHEKVQACLMLTVVVYGKKSVFWWGKGNGKWKYVADLWFAIAMGRKVKNNSLKLRRLLGSPFLIYLFVVMNAIYMF